MSQAQPLAASACVNRHSPPPEDGMNEALPHVGTAFGMKSDETDSAIPRMTDDEREAAAYRAGCAMKDSYEKYQRTGNPEHLDRAYHHLGQMRQILAGRSKEAVLRQEISKGLI